MCDQCNFFAARGGSPTDPALLAEYERVWRARTADAIAAYGQRIMAVDGWPPFAYTVGLWGAGHPELVVYGLEARTAQDLLNGVCANYVHVGNRLADGQQFEISGWSLWAMRIPRPSHIVARANSFYRRRPARSVAALQLVYPDVHGAWPWEDECHLFPGQQPLPGSFVRSRPRSA